LLEVKSLQYDYLNNGNLKDKQMIQIEKNTQQTTTSPEITDKARERQNILIRALRYYIRPFIKPIKHRISQLKWQHHADGRTLDWNWSATNFNRIAVVNLLLTRFKDPAYLEIGCASDSLFNSVPVLRKTGVDPSSGGNVRKTSDDFFHSNKERFDLVFIDGLHTYEQVRRDVVNSIKVINDGGWIVLHDMLPRDWIEHHVPIVSQGAWTGDVWKVAFELKQTDGIEFNILKIDHGVGVIKVLNRNAELKDFREELTLKEFDFYYDNLSKLPLVEWNDAIDWLRN